MGRFGRLVAVSQPRDPATATRLASVLCIVAGSVTAALAPLSVHQPSTATVIMTVVIGLVVAGIGIWVRLAPSVPPLAWTVGPYIALIVILVADVVTRDASVSGQVFFFFPILLVGKQVRRAAALGVITAAVVADACIVFPQLPIRDAVVTFAYFGSALIAAGFILVGAGQRQAALTDQLRRQAAVDPLTGLATRPVLDQAAIAALSSAASGEGTALIMLDLDEFKQVNDSWGHLAGDRVLITLAGLLTEDVDVGDVVSRLGGDEMAILLPAVSAARARERAERLIAGVRDASVVVAPDVAVNLSISIGLAHAPSHARDLRELYSAADEALYRAKRAGKNRIAIAIDGAGHFRIPDAD